MTNLGHIMVKGDYISEKMVAYGKLSMVFWVGSKKGPTKLLGWSFHLWIKKHLKMKISGAASVRLLA